MVPSTHLVGGNERTNTEPWWGQAAGHARVACEPAQPAPLSREDQEGQEQAGYGDRHSTVGGTTQTLLVWPDQSTERKGGTRSRRFEFPVSAGLGASSPRLLLLLPLPSSASTSPLAQQSCDQARGTRQSPPLLGQLGGLNPGATSALPGPPPRPRPLPGTGTSPSAALHGYRRPGRGCPSAGAAPFAALPARREAAAPPVPGSPGPRLPAALPAAGHRPDPALRRDPTWPRPTPPLAPLRAAAPLPVLLPLPGTAAAPAAGAAARCRSGGARYRGRLRPCPSASLGTLRHKFPPPRTRSRTHARVQTHTQRQRWH